MPWKESRAVDERIRFIAACSESDESLAGLCRRFGISRKTGYKRLDRYDELGPHGLLDRPPVARAHPSPAIRTFLGRYAPALARTVTAIVALGRCMLAGCGLRCDMRSPS
jgi:transposase-like protein